MLLAFLEEIKSSHFTDEEPKGEEPQITVLAIREWSWDLNLGNLISEAAPRASKL